MSDWGMVKAVSDFSAVPLWAFLTIGCFDQQNHDGTALNFRQRRSMAQFSKGVARQCESWRSNGKAPRSSAKAMLRKAARSNAKARLCKATQRQSKQQ